MLHTAQFRFPTVRQISPGDVWPLGIMGISRVHLVVNEDYTVLPSTATIATSTVCKIFQAWDPYYTPAFLVLWEVEAVVVNCDVLSTPTNFSSPHFCAELEILDHLRPLNRREGIPGNQWPVICPGIIVHQERDEGYGWAGNIKFRQIRGNKPFVVVEYFNPSGLTTNLTVVM
ncbi:hypothetical protein Fcan01_25315 [Folsomia candida]|uniref:Uncharacterized protein n=1 Tax=Folsomia candida TaxID=158441 RepID=A0A226D2S2_FOLCA|nr:hypothetical protein Fcan01_25315 [Folsomia candida]